MRLSLTEIFLGFKMDEIESTEIILGCKHVRLSLIEIFWGFRMDEIESIEIFVCCKHEIEFY